jgi:glutamate-1-semialdehyde 2,1-aminomutase
MAAVLGAVTILGTIMMLKDNRRVNAAASTSSADQRPSFAETFGGPRGHGLLPGGFGKAMTAVGPWSPMVVRGEGWRVWDDTGRELVDLNGNFTVNIHGNAHPSIVAAVEATARSGLSFGLPNRHEIDHARRLVDRLNGLDQVRYTNSGTEATQLAVRLARAHTRRSAVIVVDGSYHGWGETVLPTMGPRAERGIPPGTRAETLVVGFDDVAGLEAAVATASEKIAAVMVDLLPNRIGMVQPSDTFLQAVQRLCARHSMALIVDEVISFRLARGGLTGLRGLDADLVCLGKSIGGGLPVGALVGKAAWMAELDPFGTGLEHGGTFSGNPVTMAAGIVALDLLDEDALARIDALGTRFREQLAEPLARRGWEARGLGSLSRLYPSFARDNADVLDLQRRLWWQLHERGLLVAKHGVCAISTVMDGAVIERSADAVIDAVNTLE